MTTVVLLLSDKRSGSTFLEKELTTHAQIQHVAYTPHTYNETYYWVKAAQLLAMPKTMFSGGHYPHSYSSTAQARKSLLAGIKGNVGNFQPSDDDREMVFQGWEALCEKFANPVFIEKSPYHVHHWAALELMLQWAETTRHRVKVIALVRNPLSVMYSAFKLFHTPVDTRQFSWCKAYQNLLLMEKLMDTSQFYWVRYEDLVTDPTSEFEHLCRFIGVDHDPNLGGAAHTRSRNIWYDDSFFTLQLDPAVTRFAQYFAYASEELVNPKKTGQTISQNILNMARRFYSRICSRLYSMYKRAVLK
ncbi:MAG: sulfotransferase [Desulfobacterales bacterium]|nr:sulfotransferase [Desulfobacterales bacterium]